MGVKTRKKSNGANDWILKDDSVIHLRCMIRRDMPEVMHIEQYGQPKEPMDEESMLDFLRHRNCIGMVVELDYEHDHSIAGFIIYTLKNHSLELNNLCVHPDYQRLLVGSSMMDKMKDKLSPGRREKIIVNVRETNLAAQLFLRDNGFLAMAALRNEFDDEDGIHFMFEHDWSANP